MIPSARSVLVAALAGLLVATLALPLSAQEPFDVRIREAQLDEDGSTRLTVAVDGVPEGEILSEGAFSVVEAGVEVDGLTVTPLLEEREEAAAVALLMDIGGATAGTPHDALHDASDALVDHLAPHGIPIAVVEFGAPPEQLSDFTRDDEVLHDALHQLAAGGDSALYDAVVLGSTLLGSSEAQRNVIVFSDGADEGSEATLDDALEAAVGADVIVNAVTLETPEYDPGPLEELTGETDGRVVTIENYEEMGEGFGEVVTQIASQYVVTYTSTHHDGDELTLSVGASTDHGEADDEILVLNERVPPAEPPAELPAADVGSPPLQALGSPLALYLGLGASFVALVMLLGVAFVSTTPRPAARVLRRSLEHVGGKRQEQADSRSSAAPERSEALQRAVGLAERLPTPEGFEESLQLRLERAGWSLRSSEFLVLAAVAVLGGAALMFMLAPGWVAPLVGAGLGAAGPYVALQHRTTSRQAAFAEQLPETLQVLAGSLRAGYGVLQAIDTVVKEVDDPAASEFARVLTEARLGMPLEDALEAMADRVGSEDFRWVVLAINIQRQVGGNLAALFETVAATLRERASVRQQVKTLSAEGRLSAWVLTLLPFGLALYMIVVNPSYMALLFTRTVGLVMVFGALGLVAVGILWMRRLIRIEV